MVASSDDALRAWQFGQTGYPLVDAGMRELWATGYVPNYVRHVVAGFLIEYLNVDWRHGQLWFHDTLVDADVAIQGFMWQNGGHSGMDQWNFVMHPVYAAKSADPDGEYVRRWCPELSGLPREFVHCPWEAPATTLAAAKNQLNGNRRGHSSRQNWAFGTHGVILFQNARRISVKNITVRKSKPFAIHLGKIRRTLLGLIEFTRKTRILVNHALHLSCDCNQKRFHLLLIKTLS